MASSERRGSAQADHRRCRARRVKIEPPINFCDVLKSGKQAAWNTLTAGVPLQLRLKRLQLVELHSKWSVAGFSLATTERLTDRQT
jgi:hypothetical protein